MADSLDKQIADASGLVALLLVFVFAYFAALLPIWEEVRSKPRPPAADDVTSLRHRIAAYQVLAVALLLIITLVFALLSPLSWHSVHSTLWSPFHTLRLGLLLVDVLLLGTAGGVVTELILLNAKRHKLK